MKISIVLALALFCLPAGAEPVAPDVPATTVPVATVAAVTGEVMLAQRAQIGPAEPGSPLRPGDRLMTMDDSDVLIAFADGCSQRLADNSLLAITGASGCGQGGARQRSFRQAIGDPGGGAADEPGMSTGQKTAVTAAILLPLLWLWDHNRDDDGREPVSR
jgi:hypothetical protein